MLARMFKKAALKVVGEMEILKKKNNIEMKNGAVGSF